MPFQKPMPPMQPASPGSRPDPRRLLRSLPAVDALLQTPAVVEAADGLPRPFVVDAVRAALDEARARLLASERPIPAGAPSERAHGGKTERRGAGTEWNGAGTEQLQADGALLGPGPLEVERVLADLSDAAVARVQALKRRFLTRVINATGVVLHTNLGRAPLSAASIEAVADVSAGYSNLEYTVDAGRRGSRHDYGEAMLTRLTGAEAAMVVNNNAAAVLLVLSALAQGREVILSRGEMIEIGGAFRVPEVMTQSGCILREIGTTNRTHLRDYERAIGEQTAAILKVHPSNYKISGFTASVSAGELAPLARRYDIPLIEDLGSGVLVATEQYGLAKEPTVQASVAAGADIVTFSGDKLLGGPQAGIIVGRKDLVDRCKAHPLARALRVDKMTLAALQATLAAYLDGDVEQIPIYAMLGASVDSLAHRGRAVVAQVRRTMEAADPAFQLDVIDTISTVGGGSLPGETLPSAGIAVRTTAGHVSAVEPSTEPSTPQKDAPSTAPTTASSTAPPPASSTAPPPASSTSGTAGLGARLTPDRLAAELRRGVPPIVARIEGDTLILDLRTIDPADDETVAERLAHALTVLTTPTTPATRATPHATGDHTATGGSPGPGESRGSGGSPGPGGSDGSGGAGKADGSSGAGKADGSSGAGKADGSSGAGKADGSSGAGKADGSSGAGKADGSSGAGEADASCT